MSQILIVNEDFIPKSVERSWHDDFKAGDRCEVLEELEHGLLVRQHGQPLFVLDEEIRDYCSLEGKFSP
jgi:hypothetical protein